MKIRILTLTLIALFAISSATVAQNQERGKRNPEQREAFQKNRERVAHRMDNFFTEEQREQIKALRLETAKKVKPLRNELNELEARQQTLTTADKADMNAIYANIDKISEVKVEIQKIMAKQQQDTRLLLTPEQLLKFDAMKGRMMDKRGDNFRDRRAPRPVRG
jgi:Spy/CpxP family protein refolding chaperone